jgi:hypothetical protein
MRRPPFDRITSKSAFALRVSSHSYQVATAGNLIDQIDSAIQEKLYI